MYIHAITDNVKVLASSRICNDVKTKIHTYSITSWTSGCAKLGIYLLIGKPIRLRSTHLQASSTDASALGYKSHGNIYRAAKKTCTRYTQARYIALWVEVRQLLGLQKANLAHSFLLSFAARPIITNNNNSPCASMKRLITFHKRKTKVGTQYLENESYLLYFIAPKIFRL